MVWEREKYHAKEKLLQIHHLAIPRNLPDQSSNMPFINIDISDLIAREIRPQQRSRMLPPLRHLW